MTTPTARPTVSLLYPPGAGVRGRPSRAALDETDLGLAPIIRALDIDGRHGRFVAGVLGELCADPHTITYRQDMLDDLLRLPELAAACAGVLPHLGELAGAGRTQRWGDDIPLLQVAGRLAELDGYVGCVEGLCSALDAAGGALRAAGWLALRDELAASRADPDYQRLAAELPGLRAQLDQAGSVTLGINLDPQLRPESATVVSINRGRFAGKGTLLDALFGPRTAADAIRGITALYKADESRPRTPEHELFRDLSRLLERVAAPVAAMIATFTRLSGAGLAAIEPELAFYLGAARLVGELRAAGLALCRPEIAPAEERACTVSRIYSLDLALRLRAAHGPAGLAAALVTSDVAFGPGATLFILTGPNSGGKTTFIRAVGQAQALFQAGLPVPGTSARISPVDAIFTHFASAERLDSGGGRLAQELERLAQIFRSASGRSLVLLNEPLASTDHTSARALGRDLAAGLLLLGARAIYVTHLHELVDDALAINRAAPGAGAVSLVAGSALDADGTQPAPTYTIAPGRPQPPGYAAELARRHGLSLSQIAQTLRERGVVDGDDSEGGV
jgi:DNA mismatch repair protein MutS